MERVDWNKTKAELPILKVAHDLGYKKVHDKTSINHIILENGSGNRIRVIHPTEPRLQLYNNVNEIYSLGRNGDNGTVIDFIRNHINEFPQTNATTEIGKINDVIRSYNGSSFDYEEFCKDQGIRTNKNFNINEYPHEKAKVKDLYYLTRERGLSHETIKTFLPFIYITPKEYLGRNYFNVAFPYTLSLDMEKGKSKIQGFEERNFKFKGFSEGGDKHNSVWEANFGERWGTKNIYLFESAIDAMSYYELNKSKIDIEKSTFISFGGAISQVQAFNVIEAYPNARIVACFDNDVAGRMFDATIAAAKRGDVLRATVNKNNNVYFTYNGKPFQVEFDKQTTLKKIEELVGRRLDRKISVNKSIGKDWNEQLKQGQQKKIIALKR